MTDYSGQQAWQRAQERCDRVIRAMRERRLRREEQERRGRLTTHWADVFMEIGEPSEWPNSIRQCVFENTELTDKEQFKVIVFLFTNGISIELIDDWFRETFPSTTREQWRKIHWIMEQLRRTPTRWRAWNVRLQQTV